MHSFIYFIKEALDNSKKNFSTTFGAVITIFLSLLVIGVFMSVSILVDQGVQTLEDEVKISIFLNDKASAENISSLNTFMDGIAEVDTVTHVSKEQSLEQFKETSSKNFAIVEQFDGNPLPAKFSITLKDPEQVQKVVDQIVANETYLQVIDDPKNPTNAIKYGQDYVSSLFAFATIARVVSLVLVLLLIFVALIFINNTIRLAILARRKEIAIMRLVGASNGFIRGPFLMEGVLQAIVGAALAAGLLSLLASNLLPLLGSWLDWDASLEMWQIYSVLFAVGLAIGLFGSMFAMRRYLKV